MCGCWGRVIESKEFGFVPVMCFLFPHTSLIGPSVRRQTTDMWRKKERVWERRRVVHYGQCEQIRHSWRSRLMHTHILMQYLTYLFMEIKIKPDWDQDKTLCCKTFSEILKWDVVQLCHSGWPSYEFIASKQTHYHKLSGYFLICSWTCDYICCFSWCGDTTHTLTCAHQIFWSRKQRQLITNYWGR